MVFEMPNGLAEPSVDDVFYMHLALRQAQLAYAADEVPIGAVLVQGNCVIGRGFNQTIKHCDPTAHAELQALREGCLQQRNYRLPEATLYVTIEPCTMCLGALIHARVARVVFGANEPKAGRVCSHSLVDDPCFNHKIAVTGGVAGDLAGDLMQRFFIERRALKKSLKRNTQSF